MKESLSGCEDPDMLFLRKIQREEESLILVCRFERLFSVETFFDGFFIFI